MYAGTTTRWHHSIIKKNESSTFHSIYVCSGKIMIFPSLLVSAFYLSWAKQFICNTYRFSSNNNRMVNPMASYQLFTCKRVRLVCAAICLFSSSVGYGCWNKQTMLFCSIFDTSHKKVWAFFCPTMRCWKSQERMIFVACLGSTPLLFLDFLSSLSNRDVRSMFTFINT